VCWKDTDKFRCPKCGGEHRWHTHVGEPRPGDTHIVECKSCGWIGHRKDCGLMVKRIVTVPPITIHPVEVRIDQRMSRLERRIASIEAVIKKGKRCRSVC
jgi:uncharacterized Zn finger protein